MSIESSHAQLAFIVHSHLRWDFVWQRPQQIMSRLAGHHPILFLEEPLPGKGYSHLQVTVPFPNVVRVVPFLDPISGETCDQQCGRTLRLFKQAIREHPILSHRFDTFIQWFYSPQTAYPMISQLNSVGIVYDCMDELANFRFAPPDIAEREKWLISKADIVFTGGHHLYRSKSRLHHNVHFFGCGVDVDHYGKAMLDKTEPPWEVASLPRPVLGYVGVIDERLDYELLRRVGDAFPSGSVVMVGPLAKVDEQALPKSLNIHWLGKRPYEDLPALVKSFDVCLMPFAMNEATQYINPTKTLEYMSAGKPIVSTAVPDVVRNFTPIVDVAYSHDEFIDALSRAYQQPDEDRIARGIDLANESSWESIVTSMRRHILDRIARLPVQEVSNRF
jgi:glycosyltransferase involved in cell wall biosynthesis